MTAKGPTDQELTLRERSVRDFYGRSEFHRNRLIRAGFGKHGVRTLDGLHGLAPMLLDDVDASSQLLVEGNERPRHRRQYWPLQWVMAGDLPLAYSAEDLTLLGGLGRDLLEAAGVSPDDVLANLLPAEASRDQLQVQLGAQAAGLSAASFGVGATVAHVKAISPTVIAGEAKELNRLFDAAKTEGADLLRGVHTLLVSGPTPHPRVWKKLTDHLVEDNPYVLDEGEESPEPPTKIVRMWAPDGVFAAWVQCRGGTAFHTWPDIELVEIVDPVTGLPSPETVTGSVLWTGLHWYATAMLRLRTDGVASMHSGVCPTCGRTSPRLVADQKAPGFAAVLDSNAYVDEWAAELQRTEESDELVIWLSLRDDSHSLQVIADVDAKIGPARVQVVDKEVVQRRIDDANGERFGDRRAIRLQG